MISLTPACDASPVVKSEDDDKYDEDDDSAGDDDDRYDHANATAGWAEYLRDSDGMLGFRPPAHPPPPPGPQPLIILIVTPGHWVVWKALAAAKIFYFGGACNMSVSVQIKLIKPM